MTDSPTQHAAAVEAVGLSVALGGRPILRGVDLAVPRGQFLALMGANGSGKSTLVRALVGLNDATTGTVRMLGHDLDRFEEWHRVGFVPQRATAASGIPASVWEVVASGRLTRRRLFRPLGRDDRRTIDAALEVVGLSERRRDTVSQLSGGQQQRVLIARALAAQPDVFFLDEPTAGVDLANQLALADTLEHLKDEGATVVLVAHELGPLAPLVDRAVVMRDGRIAYDGPALADHAVHGSWLGEPHTHHHHPGSPGHGNRADHVPGVRSPLDRLSQEDRR